MRLALATCATLPEPDPDNAPLRAALAANGIDAAHLAWDAADSPNWRAFDAVLLRSTWNYYEDAPRFLRWCESAASATRLLNPLPAVRWNIHKQYLLELEARGIPIAPTELLRRGEAPDLTAILLRRGWSDVVIKPAISAASFETRRFSNTHAPEAHAFLAAHLAERDMLVQQFLPGVETTGERALIWIDGELTHAIRKNPRFAGGVEQVSPEALDPTPAERDLAAQTLAAAPIPARDLLYARIDVFPGPKGEPLLSELELIEPSLYFPQRPAALQRFVAAVTRRVGPR